MGIPLLDDNGNLPSGIWACTRKEIEERFGQTRRRRELLRLFFQFLEELPRRGIHGTILVDGSFVTADPAPKDIDVLVILPPTVYSEKRNEVRALRVRWAPDVDVFFVPRGTPEHRELVRFFGEDRLYRSRGLIEVVTNP